MDIKDFLSSTNTLTDVPAPDKSRLLTDLAARAASTLQLDASTIVGEVLKRESLGSTGVGGGVAIPHARIADLKKPFGILARLRKPIAFDAIDGHPVDVVFLLLLPTTVEGEQLNVLAAVARKLRDKEALQAIRNASDAGSLHGAMTADTQTASAPQSDRSQ